MRFQEITRQRLTKYALSWLSIFALLVLPTSVLVSFLNVPQVAAAQSSTRVTCLDLDTSAPEAYTITVGDNLGGPETYEGGYPVFSCLGTQDLVITTTAPAATVHTLTASCPTSTPVFEQKTQTFGSGPSASTVQYVVARCNPAGEVLTLTTQDPPGVETQQAGTFPYENDPTSICPPNCGAPPPALDPACADLSSDGSTAGVAYSQCIEDIEQFGARVPPNVREICNRRASPPGGDSSFDVAGCIAEATTITKPDLFEDAASFWCAAQTATLPTSTPEEVEALAAANKECRDAEYTEAGLEQFIEDPVGGDAAENDSCENGDGALRWILCPVIIITAGTLNWVDSRIQELLQVDRGYYDNQGIKDASANIRNVAYLILVPIMLVMVISTAMGFEFISAYTMKRALPRLFAAVIFITLSYAICTFLIDLSNAVGNGTQGLLTAPFTKISQNAAGEPISVDTLTLNSLFGGSWATSVVGVFGAAIATVVIFWLFGSVILMFSLAALGVLLLRQMFIIALLLLAPLAILAWIFPGNDKLWKAWWSSFSKLLMMYPIIMGLIAIGHIFAFIIHENEDTANIEGALRPFMILAAYMIPYALIVFVFRFVGGTFATISGMAQNATRGGAQRRANKRREKVAGLGKRIGDSNFLKGGQAAKKEVQAQEGFAGYRDRETGEFLEGYEPVAAVDHSPAQAANRRYKFNRALGALTPSNLKAGGIPFKKDIKGQSRGAQFADKVRTQMNTRDEVLATEFMKNSALFQSTAGDDDFQKGRLFGGDNFGKFRSAMIEAGRERFQKQDPKTGQLLDELLPGAEQEIRSLFNTSQRMRREVGGRASNIAIGRALSNSSTAFKNTKILRYETDEGGKVVYEKDENGNDRKKLALDENGKVQYDRAQDAQGKMGQVINTIAGNDRNLKNRLLVEFRDNQVRAGRGDMGGASFSDMSMAIDKLYRSDQSGDGSYSVQQATNDIVRAYIRGKGFSQMIGEKGEGAVSVGPVLAQMAKEGLKGNAREAGLALSSVAAALSGLSYATPEIRETLTKHFTGMTVDASTGISQEVRKDLGLPESGTISLTKILETARLSPGETGQAHRQGYYEYGSSFASGGADGGSSEEKIKAWETSGEAMAMTDYQRRMEMDRMRREAADQAKRIADIEAERASQAGGPNPGAH